MTTEAQAGEGEVHLILRDLRELRLELSVRPHSLLELSRPPGVRSRKSAARVRRRPLSKRVSVSLEEFLLRKGRQNFSLKKADLCGAREQNRSQKALEALRGGQCPNKATRC